MLARFLFRAALLPAALAGSCFAEKLEIDPVTEPVVKSRVESGAVAPKQRHAAIRDLFHEAGCEAEEQPVDRNSGNVICTLPGETASTIVVDGHFDFADSGKGIKASWTIIIWRISMSSWSNRYNSNDCPRAGATVSTE